MWLILKGEKCPSVGLWMLANQKKAAMLACLRQEPAEDSLLLFLAAHHAKVGEPKTKMTELRTQLHHMIFYLKSVKLFTGEECFYDGGLVADCCL